MLRSVIFDIDDTLYDYEGINDKAIEYAGSWLCEKVNISRMDYRAAYDRARQITKNDIKDRAAGHNRLIYFQHTSELLGLNPIAYSLELYEMYWDYMLNHMTLSEGALALIKRLKKDGIRIGICTDLTSHIQHRKLRKLGIAPFIDAFVSSEEADAEKPDRRIFDLLLKKLDAAPDEALYVGDSYKKDIVGAAASGMFPIWYNPRGEKEADADCLSFLEIRHFKQLEKYIYEER